MKTGVYPSDGRGKRYDWSGQLHFCIYMLQERKRAVFGRLHGIFKIWNDTVLHGGICSGERDDVHDNAFYRAFVSGHRRNLCDSGLCDTDSRELLCGFVCCAESQNAWDESRRVRPACRTVQLFFVTDVLDSMYLTAVRAKRYRVLTSCICLLLAAGLICVGVYMSYSV